MNLTLREASCTEAAESTSTPVIQKAFGQDAARGVARAQEQHVVRPVWHCSSSLRGLAAGFALIQSDGRRAIGRTFASREECFPLDPLRICDPALLAPGIAAGRRTFLQDRRL